jgi:DNA-3-methyladenine glycosylase II
MKLTPTHIESARRHLRAADPVMKIIIDAVGPYTLRFERDRFAMLVRSIVSQQISTTAARAIRNRGKQRGRSTFQESRHGKVECPL